MLEVCNENVRAHEKHPQRDDYCDPGKVRHGQQQYQTKCEAHERYLLSDGVPTSSPLPAASGLCFTGFFFPLLQAMFGMGGEPAIRQQNL